MIPLMSRKSRSSLSVLALACLSSLLAGCGHTPEEQFKLSVMPLLRSGDVSGFERALHELFKTSPGFETLYGAGLPEYLEDAMLPSEPRLHLLTPRGLMTYLQWRPADGRVAIRWFDERKDRPMERLSVRLSQARAPLAGEPDYPPELDPNDPKSFLAENLLNGSETLEDGSRRFYFGTSHLPADWLSLQIRDPLSPLGEDRMVEDSTWFHMATMAGHHRIAFNTGNSALKAFRQRVGLVAGDTDLLLARLMLHHVLQNSTARMLEQIHQDGGETPGSRVLLEQTYRLLGRGPGVPRETPQRDIAADWDRELQ
jgi:hypothetical protein